MKKSTVPKNARKPRSDALRNRERILEVAKQVFTRRGADASMDEIAKRAKIGPGTLYRHFPTRDELLATVYITEVEKLAAAQKTLSAELPPIDAERNGWRPIAGISADHAGHGRSCQRAGRPRCRQRRSSPGCRSHRLDACHLRPLHRRQRRRLARKGTEIRRHTLTGLPPLINADTAGNQVPAEAAGIPDPCRLPSTDRAGWPSAYCNRLGQFSTI